MNISKEDMKKTILLLTAVVIGYWALQNLALVIGIVEYIIKLFGPFLMGGVFAFVIKVPMNHIEKHLFAKTKNSTLKKIRRPCAIFLVFICVIVVCATVIFVVVPEIVDTIANLINHIPDAFEKLMSYLYGLDISWPEVLEQIEKASVNWEELIQNTLKFSQNQVAGIFSSGIGLVGGILNGVVSFFIGIVFAVYILSQKEKLGCQLKQIMYATLHEETVERILHILNVSNKIFANFLSGQCLEAIILGTLFFIMMTILRLPYALLISILISFTALIPIVGAFIGCIIGIFLIVMVAPMKALVFVILFIVLQQVEGNLIYPHVVGNSVGLPSIWVLMAITIGGKLMGIFGMLIFIPICSVVYTLFREFIKTRLQYRNIKAHKWMENKDITDKELEDTTEENDVE